MRRLTLMLVPLIAVATLGTVAASAHYVKMTDVRVPMDDGVIMTADVYVPTMPDRDGDGHYPCVVELTPYRKEARASEGASFLPHQGIALIEVDARGTGGSEGEYDIVFSVREQADAAAWVEWAATGATKPDDTALCEDEVGMYGGSYSGIIQYLVASLPETAQGDVPARPAHLAAIAPQRAYGDLYRDIVYHGGMVIASFGLIWSSGTSAYYVQPPGDVTGPAGQAAWLDHARNNDPMIVPYLTSPFADATYTSDDTDPPYTQRLYEDSSVLSRIENLTVPTLHLAGWFDSFTRGQLMTFQQALEAERALGGRGPNYLIVGPWNHAGTHFITPDQGYRQHLADWYHWWLEDRPGGAIDEPAWLAEPRVRWFQMGSGKVNAQGEADGAWRTADQWPPADVAVGRWLLEADGSLKRCDSVCPVVPGTRAYTSNPLAGTGEILSRWDNASGATPHPQWDQRVEEGRGLTYLSGALAEPLTVAGPIGLTLTADVVGLDASGAPAGLPDGLAQLLPEHLDTDFVVKLSEVAPDGTATLVTQGYLRASHRALDLDRSGFIGEHLMAAYHPHTRAALDPPLSGDTVAYEIELWPTAKTFRVDHRLRLDVFSADTPNHLTVLKPTVNRIWTGSNLRLPLLPATAGGSEG